jgi:hypothetical protein
MILALNDLIFPGSGPNLEHINLDSLNKSGSGSAVANSFLDDNNEAVSFPTALFSPPHAAVDGTVGQSEDTLSQAKRKEKLGFTGGISNRHSGLLRRWSEKASRSCIFCNADAENHG